MALTTPTSPISLKLVAQPTPQLPTSIAASRRAAPQKGEEMTGNGGNHDLEAEYKRRLEMRHMSPRTVKQWMWILRRFTGWLDADPLTASREDIERWLYVAQPDLSAGSRRNYGNGLACFYQWAAREGMIERAPTDDLEKPKETAHAPDPCPTAIVRKAMDTAEPVTKAMIAFAAFQGLRCGEIAAMRWDHIGDAEMMVMGKGRKQRRLPLHRETAQALAALHRTGPEVFPDASAHGVSQRGSTFLRAIGLNTRMAMHSLRAWYATTLYQASGHDLLLVRNMLGHSSTEHTARYAQVADTAAMSAVAGIAA